MMKKITILFIGILLLSEHSNAQDILRNKIQASIGWGEYQELGSAKSFGVHYFHHLSNGLFIHATYEKSAGQSDLPEDYLNLISQNNGTIGRYKDELLASITDVNLYNVGLAKQIRLSKPVVITLSLQGSYQSVFYGTTNFLDFTPETIDEDNYHLIQESYDNWGGSISLQADYFINEKLSLGIAGQYTTQIDRYQFSAITAIWF